MSPRKRQIKKEMLPAEEQVDDSNKYELPVVGEQLDYSQFVSNNWLKEGIKNDFLESIDEMGCALWLGHNGMSRWRVSKDEEVLIMQNDEETRRAISAVLDRRILRLFKSAKIDGTTLPPEVEPYELIAAKDEFTPFALSEFYMDNGLWYRTSFKPSDYIAKLYEEPKISTPDTILSLINNLAGHNDEYFKWILNWLAGFFQTLKKSQVALVLRGDQGSGKGIFFTKIITPLFGKDYCITVDSCNLESNFKNWIDGRLFLNLNEVAVDMKGRRNVKNFLKQLVTDELVNVETKYKDAGEKRAFANILITSNEAFPIEIELSDRRFTVFQTGKGLKAQGWKMNKAIDAINDELPTFAEYLHNYKVDWELYNTAIDTPSKQAIVDGTTSQVRRYIHAITNKEISFFGDFEDEPGTGNIYRELKESFDKGKISQPLLYEAFDKMFETKKSAKKLMSEIRNICPDFFGNDKLKKANGQKYYCI